MHAELFSVAAYVQNGLPARRAAGLSEAARDGSNRLLSCNAAIAHPIRPPDHCANNRAWSGSTCQVWRSACAIVRSRARVWQVLASRDQCRQQCMAAHRGQDQHGRVPEVPPRFQQAIGPFRCGLIHIQQNADPPGASCGESATTLCNWRICSILIDPFAPAMS